MAQKNLREEHINNPETQIDGILSPFLQRIRFRKALPFIQGNRILDIGCSNGEIIELIPGSTDYIGIEGNIGYHNQAKSLHPQHTFLNCYLDGSNVLDIELPERDTILMLAVLEHLDHPVDTLRNLAKFLARDGRIVITTPSHWAENILKWGSRIRLFSSEMDEHRNHFNKKHLEHIIKSAGFSISHFSTFELGLNYLVVINKPDY